MKRRKTSANVLTALSIGNMKTPGSFDDVKTDLMAAKDTIIDMKKVLFKKVNNLEENIVEEIRELKTENRDLKNMVKDLVTLQKESLHTMNTMKVENLELKETIKKIEAKNDI
mmetsp:Transcript_21421/g.33113  ORF Transcript_21421/g.33113 Transcript_21421/m.33113 type:complete len:113 (+) Transcript_21421:298-636(+)